MGMAAWLPGSGQHPQAQRRQIADASGTPLAVCICGCRTPPPCICACPPAYRPARLILLRQRVLPRRQHWVRQQVRTAARLASHRCAAEALAFVAGSLRSGLVSQPFPAAARDPCYAPACAPPLRRPQVLRGRQLLHQRPVRAAGHAHVRGQRAVPGVQHMLRRHLLRPGPGEWLRRAPLPPWPSARPGWLGAAAVPQPLAALDWEGLRWAGKGLDVVEWSLSCTAEARRTAAGACRCTRRTPGVPPARSRVSAPDPICPTCPASLPGPHLPHPTHHPAELPQRHVLRGAGLWRDMLRRGPVL